MERLYFNAQFDFFSSVLGFFIAAIILVTIYSILIEINKQKHKKEKSDNLKFSSLRLLENYSGMAFASKIDE
ncbi:MAG: hypothetical protein R6U15_05525, partial [Candidatus Izemoplasmatales bacterium]